MKETWIAERCLIQLPGLTIDRHLSAPNEISFSGCSHHLLCVLLSDGNQQKITRIGKCESVIPQTKGEFWICPANTSGLWAWDSTDRSLMFEIDPYLLKQIAEEACGIKPKAIELIGTASASDPQIEAIANLLQTEFNRDDIGGEFMLNR
jgi:AraC family transcriptional regulator